MATSITTSWFTLMMVSILAMNIQVRSDSRVPMYLLERAITKGAVCLDGSAPAYSYVQGSGDRSHSWIVYLESGAWCHNLSDCYDRTHTKLGSSNSLRGAEQTFWSLLDSNCTSNPDFCNWHKLYIHNCDGSSFMSDVTDLGFQVYLLLLCRVILELSTVKGSQTSSGTTFDVTKLGALGDGRTDDTKAFESAWTAACNQSLGSSKVVVPNGKTFLVSSIKFSGPCKSRSITFEILGTIVAHRRESWGKEDFGEWIFFHEVEGLSVVGNGQGVIDGQGDSWWRVGNQSHSPTALRFSHCNNLHVSGLKHMNSQRNHISINGCQNANISNLHITAPGTSPNTDGIDISSSTNIHIQDCVMATGDDCIAINGGTSGVYISGITCGPGHGISVGSLGRNGNHDEVEGIHVSNCTFIKTQNGVRIKSWQGGSGFAKNIVFSNINFEESDNPIVIDQYYCPHQTCDDKVSAVKVSDVKYIGLHGTSIAKNAAISLRCSQTVPCTDIVLNDVDLKVVGPGTPVAQCTNAHGTSNACIPPITCLQS